MKTLMSIKTDKDVKTEAQAVAREIGIPLSTIINAYLRELIVTRQVRFFAPPKMTKDLERIITKAERDFAAKKDISQPLSSAAEIAEYLDSK